MKSRADLILGIQWGDEGKGRVVDAYATNYDIVARFGGGDNAGHSIVVGEQKIALHIVPSGALVEATELFIGGGTVVGLAGLVKELDMLEGIGVDTRVCGSRIVRKWCSLIMPRSIVLAKKLVVMTRSEQPGVVSVRLMSIEWPA